MGKHCPCLSGIKPFRNCGGRDGLLREILFGNVFMVSLLLWAWAVEACQGEQMIESRANKLLHFFASKLILIGSTRKSQNWQAKITWLAFSTTLATERGENTSLENPERGLSVRFYGKPTNRRHLVSIMLINWNGWIKKTMPILWEWFMKSTNIRF